MTFPAAVKEILRKIQFNEVLTSDEVRTLKSFLQSNALFKTITPEMEELIELLDADNAQATYFELTRKFLDYYFLTYYYE